MDSTFREALKLTLSKLKSSDRFESEVRSLLAARYADQTEDVLVWLNKNCLLSDSRAAQSLIQARSGKRAVSVAKLLEELDSRGAPEQLAREAVANIEDNDQINTLLRLKYKPLPENRAKAGRFLFARGFDEDLIRSALDQFFGHPVENEEAL